MFVAANSNTSTTQPSYAYSYDGINWVKDTDAERLNRANWYSVCYGNGMFVTVSSNTSSYPSYAYSYDGINWVPDTNAERLRRAEWRSVCYGNGMFVVVNYGTNTSYPSYAYSYDGINWVPDTNAAILPRANWFSLCYGNGVFVVVNGNTSTNTSYPSYAYHNAHQLRSSLKLTSPNIDEMNNTMNTLVESVNDYNKIRPFLSTIHDMDINWVPDTNAERLNRAGWRSVCYGNGMFVAVDYSTNSSYPSYAYSYDGITWVVDTNAERLNKANWQSICYGNGMFVAVSNSMSSGPSYAYSYDGINWVPDTNAERLSRAGWQSICYGNGMFVVVDGSGNDSYPSYAYSYDGINWVVDTNAERLPRIYWLQSICYGNGMFVAVNGNINTGPSYAYSYDGINWVVDTNAAILSRGKWYSVCYGNGMFVVVGIYNSSGPSYAYNNAYQLRSSLNLTSPNIDTLTTNAQSSDRRLKSNITALQPDSSISIIDQLQTYSFNLSTDSSRLHYGLIAQELQPIMPELVLTDNSPQQYLSIRYIEFIPHIINYLKELHKSNNELQHQVLALQNEVEKLKDEEKK